MGRGRTTIPPPPTVNNSRVSSGYGRRDAPVAGASTNHKGKDIAAPTGTPIKVNHHGTVTHAGALGTAGNAVIVKDANGYETRYYHMHRVDVKVGDTVAPGKQIGLVGSTGKSTGPHVHFEVRKDGYAINHNTGERIGAGGYYAGSGSDGQTDPHISGNLLPMDSQNMLRDGLAKDDDYYPNYLNDFYQSTYHLTLFMVEPKTFASVYEEGVMETSADVARYLKDANKVVIAESGVTGGISFSELTMTAKVIDKDEHAGHEFEIKLIEPLGTSFYEVVSNASNKLGIETMTDSPFFLQISFKGYSSEGEPLPNLLADYSPLTDAGNPTPKFTNGGVWTYMLNLLSVGSRLTESGVEHDLKCYTGVPKSDRDGTTIPQNLTISGNNIGEILDDLAEKLNAAQKERYTEEIATYRFTIDQNDAIKTTGNPRSWTLVPEEQFSTDESVSMKKEGKPTIVVLAGYKIETLLRAILSNTNEVLQLAKGIKKTNSSEDEDPTAAREQVIPGIRADVRTPGPFSTKNRRYHKEYIYRIIPRWTNALVVDPKQVENAQSPSTQQDMVKTLREKGFFRKRFDYYYTGENTEIKNLDVQFNIYWSAMIPNVIGWLAGHAQYTAQDRVNITAIEEFNKHKQEAEKYASQANAEGAKTHAAEVAQEGYEKETLKGAASAELIKAVSSRDYQKIDKIDPHYGDLIRTADTHRENFNQAKTKRDEARAKMAKAGGGITESSPPHIWDGDKVQYAEDLVEPIKAPLGVRISQAMSNSTDDDLTGTGVATPYHRDRAVFGALVEQLYGANDNMLDLEMDVRGDPYWLGDGNIITGEMARDSVVAPYDRGEVVFFLKVNFPFGGLDENGRPIFRNYTGDDTRKDTFSGLYRVREVVSTFSEGEFSQRIKSIRHPLVDVAKALGYDGPQEFDFGKQPSEFDDFDELREGAGADGMKGGAEGPGPKGRVTTTTAEKKKMMQSIYDELRDEGFTHEAAMQMLGQIGRETSFEKKHIFGTHIDDHNHQTNGGIISWQKDRRIKFNNYMKGGIASLEKKGITVTDDHRLRLQVEFLAYEMRNKYKGSWKVATTQTDLKTLEKNFSDVYIGWRSDDPKYETKGRQNMADWYETAKSVVTKR